jgi:hypothetical protein
MEDASQDMGLDVFSDSDISDDSVKNSDDEDEFGSRDLPFLVQRSTYLLRTTRDYFLE